MFGTRVARCLPCPALPWRGLPWPLWPRILALRCLTSLFWLALSSGSASRGSTCYRWTLTVWCATCSTTSTGDARSTASRSAASPADSTFCTYTPTDGIYIHTYLHTSAVCVSGMYVCMYMSMLLNDGTASRETHGFFCVCRVLRCFCGVGR